MSLRPVYRQDRESTRVDRYISIIYEADTAGAHLAIGFWLQCWAVLKSSHPASGRYIVPMQQVSCRLAMPLSKGLSTAQPSM